MIYNGIFSFYALYFLFGVAVTLIVMCAALWIATKVVERKIKKMEGEKCLRD